MEHTELVELAQFGNSMRLLHRIWSRSHHSVLVAVCALTLSGCGSQLSNHSRPGTDLLPPTSTFVSPGAVPLTGSATEQEVLSAQNERARKREVTVGATVFKKLRDDTEGLPHERFLIGLKNGSTVLVAHDTKFAPYVPLHDGDFVRIHGEYIWNPKGGVIHWTHHSDTPHHEGGWIELNGQKYQ